MTTPLPTWLVTIRRDEHHTYDHLINARSAYSAGWIVRQIQPGARIVAIRPAHKIPPVAESAAS
jgi:hypothetical protein